MSGDDGKLESDELQDVVDTCCSLLLPMRDPDGGYTHGDGSVEITVKTLGEKALAKFNEIDADGSGMLDEPEELRTVKDWCYTLHH